MKIDNSLLEQFKHEKFDIIILAGQSNAMGCGLGSVANEYEPCERIMHLYDDANFHFEKDADGNDYLWIPEECQRNIGIASESGEGNNKVGNFSLIFAKLYLDRGLLEAGRKLLIVKAAVGGTGFAKKQWGVGNVLYERIVDMTKTALDLNFENRVVAILWHQGEHDAFENENMSNHERYTFYLSSISAMFMDYIDKFALHNVSIVAGGFCAEWYLKNKNNCDVIMSATRDFLQNVGGAFADSEGLLSNNEKNNNGDDIHFCREALYELGDRYFKSFLKLKNEK